LLVSLNNGTFARLSGHFNEMIKDLNYEFNGTWKTHPKYGKTFLVENYRVFLIQNKENLIKYLASDFFHGIGEKTAEKIVDLYGFGAIDEIINNPERLKEIGFSTEKIENIRNKIIENKDIETTLIELYKYDISAKIAIKIYEIYKSETIRIVKKNCYQLIFDVSGIGFKKADEIAEKLQIKKNDPRRISAAILYILDNHCTEKGWSFIYLDAFTYKINDFLGFQINLEEAIKPLINEQKIILSDNKVFSKRIYDAEISLSKNLLNDLLSKEELNNNINYTEKQKDAIISSLTNKISIITGGPGTGKTTIINAILNIYFQINNIFYRKNIGDEIGLIAPTGRAAKRMGETIKNEIGKNMEPKTIHRFLKYDGFHFKYNLYNKCPHKLLIIDEASMLDIFLAKDLFEALDSNIQVIIVGDADQLPSVGPGMVLKDIIDSNIIKTIKLEEIQRQAKNSNISILANNVNKGKIEFEILENAVDLKFINCSKEEEIKNHIHEFINDKLDQFNLIDDIQILLPSYKGTLGINNLNNYIQNLFNKPQNEESILIGDIKFCKNDKVIQIVNNYDLEVMNGEIGFVEDIISNDENKILRVNFDGNKVDYKLNQISDNLKIAYAISIHKSQGSEYKIIILPLLNQHYFMITRELIYTAITRAKELLFIIGNMEILKFAANNLSIKRLTMLKSRLIDVFKYERENLCLI